MISTPGDPGTKKGASAISWRMKMTLSPFERADSITLAAFAVACSMPTRGSLPVGRYSFWRSTTMIARLLMGLHPFAW